MRSAVILAALAVGTCAKVIQKEVYVTEWTTTTVTETITQWPNGPSTATLVKQHPALTTKLAEAPIPTVDLSKKATAAAVDSAPAPAAPAPTASAVEVESVQTSSASTSSATTSSSTSSAEPIQPVTSSATSSAAPVETSSAAAPSSTSTSASGSYQESVLENHNIHRRVHSADDMTWSAELEDIARQVAEKCVYAHDT